MATPEEEIASLQEQLRLAKSMLEKFGERTGAVSKAIDSMTKITAAGVKGQEAVNREKIAEKTFTKNASDELKKLAKEVSEGAKTQEQFNEELDRQRSSIKENTDLTERQKASLLSSIDAAKSRAITEAQRDKILEGFNNTLQKTSGVLAPFGAVLGSIVGVYKSSATGLEGATGLVKAEIGLVSKGLTSAGEGIGAVGAAGMAAGGKLGKLGAAASIFGEVLKGAGKLGQPLSEVAEFMGGEAVKFTKAYTQITAAGAGFADGLSGLRNAAGVAGLQVEDMAEVVANNTEALVKSGMGVGEGTRALARASAQLRDPDKGLGLQLFRLGVTDIKEQTALAAQTMGMLKSQGYSSLEIEKKVAETTVQYTKDLQTLQGITGEDIKKKQRAAEMASMEADIMAKLNPEDAARFQAALRTMPDELKKGFMEAVSSGGTVVDTATNVALSQSQALKGYFDQAYAAVYDTAKDSTQVQNELAIGRAAAAEGLKAEIREGGASINFAARMTGDALFQGAATIINSFSQYTPTVKDTEANIKAMNDMANTSNRATNEMGGVIDEFNRAKVAIQQLTLSDQGMEAIFKVMRGGIDTLNAFLDKIKQFLGLPIGGPGGGTPGPMSQQEQSSANATALAGYGAAASLIGTGITSLLSIPSTLMGAFTQQQVAGTAHGQAYMQSLQEDYGGMLGAMDSGLAFGTAIMGANKPNANIPSNAGGGIVSGPASGYPVMMHGKEMVIPLPESINPSDIKKSSLEDGTQFGSESMTLNQYADQISKMSRTDDSVPVLTRLSDQMEELLTATRLVVANTERTARGVA